MRKSCSKVIVENFFEPCVLFLLLKKKGYGYEIKENLDKKCSCSVNIGNLYRCLGRMQKAGYVNVYKEKSKIGPVRKVYEITESGIKYLNAWIEQLEMQSKIINKLINNFKLYDSDKSR